MPSDLDILYSTAMKTQAARVALYPLPAAGRMHRMSNPLCGDRIDVGFSIGATARIESIGIAVRGCLLCRASAVLMCQSLSQATLEEARAWAERVSLLEFASADGLQIFAPVVAYPARHRCVTLPWEALRANLG